MQWFLELPNVVVDVYTIHLRAPSIFHFPSLAESPSDSPTRLNYTQCCLWPFSPIFPWVWNLQRAALAGSEWNPTSGSLGHEGFCWLQRTSNPATVMPSVSKLEGYIPLTSKSGGSAQPFCKWSHRAPVRIVEKNMGSDRLGWAGCWWVAGMGWGQLVAAQSPPNFSLTFPQRDGGENWKAKSEKNSWVKMKAVNKWMGKRRSQLMQRQSLITSHQQSYVQSVFKQQLSTKSPCFMMSMLYLVWNIPGQFGSAVPFQPLPYSQPTHGAAGLETEQALVLWKHCSAAPKQRCVTCILLVTTLNHSTVLATWRKSPAPHPDPV